MSSPAFLALPERSPKPRTVGLTHVLDKGLTLEAARSALAAGAPHVDIWKFGWGTAYLDKALPAKLELLRTYGIRSCLGGTLLEVSWVQGKVQQCLDWAADVGIDSVEVSRGVAAMTLTEKHELLRRAAQLFVVISEVGRKNPEQVLTAEQWTHEVAGDLAAGARWVITEGRESGTAGIYRNDGSIRTDAVAAAVRGGGVDRLLFEAPRKDQQAWLIRTFGPEVNLANIATDDALALETLRLGLRADTFDGARRRLPA
ncbi:MAG TPA: phosphosulfolactate synthase [Nocardioides sp.]|uniref:phosphosulfolactate synthase n=1 Tax=Nocardioides sp. TaxID=35761 RepID=UPI002E32C9B9|nr:phosphosulfolactate synthase [Nocardioides sp.]HEX5087764.1 phosphosulfolactate synthase [Nocardioides sp.]